MQDAIHLTMSQTRFQTDTNKIGTGPSQEPKEASVEAAPQTMQPYSHSISNEFNLTLDSSSNLETLKPAPHFQSSDLLSSISANEPLIAVDTITENVFTSEPLPIDTPPHNETSVKLKGNAQTLTISFPQQRIDINKATASLSEVPITTGVHNNGLGFAGQGIEAIQIEPNASQSGETASNFIKDGNIVSTTGAITTGPQTTKPLSYETAIQPENSKVDLEKGLLNSSESQKNGIGSPTNLNIESSTSLNTLDALTTINDGGFEIEILKENSTTQLNNIPQTNSVKNIQARNNLMPSIQTPALQALSEAVVAARETSKGVSIRLDPPELGRVYIDFIFEADRPVIVVIKAETPEADFQLRERAEPFLNLLREQGLDDITLQFSMSDENTFSEHHKSVFPAEEDEASFIPLNLTSMEAQTKRKSASLSNLDIRL